MRSSDAERLAGLYNFFTSHFLTFVPLLTIKQNIMETMEKIMNIEEIADKFVNWRNNDEAGTLRSELYSPDIESIEDGNTSEIGHVKGMEGLKKKGQGLSQDFVVHHIKASDPVVADNFFSVKFEMDITDKRSGKRSVLSEIGVYKVDDGKIVKEHYFMF